MLAALSLQTEGHSLVEVVPAGFAVRVRRVCLQLAVETVPGVAAALLPVVGQELAARVVVLAVVAGVVVD